MMHPITAPAPVAFIGLGTMGHPMATRLMDAGFKVSVFDTAPEARRRFADLDCIVAGSPAEAALGARALITMLPTGSDVREALFGKDGAAPALDAGALVIDMSTVNASDSVDTARALAALGLRPIDAPVARSPEHARKGQLLVLAGGEGEDIEAATPILNCFAETVYALGPQGSGIRMKLINNYMSMVGMVLASEGLTMAAKAGLDRGLAVEILSRTPAGLGQLTTNFPRKVLADDVTPDFPLRMGLKDITLALALGADLAAPLPLGAASRELFSLAAAWGRSDEDCTAMLRLLEDIACVARR